MAGRQGRQHRSGRRHRFDLRFLDGHGRANLEVRKHDILTDPLEEAAFDVVHAPRPEARLPELQRALERLVPALRPGGWLVLEDGDFGGVMPPAIAHHTDPPEHAALDQRIMRASRLSVASPMLMLTSAPRMVRGLADAGMVNIAAEAHTALVLVGPRSGSQGWSSSALTTW